MKSENLKAYGEALNRLSAATVVGFHKEGELGERLISKVDSSTDQPNRTQFVELLEGLPAGFTDVPGYDVYEFLGRGAHAVVYRARQRDLHRIVALKFLVSRSPRDIARFRAEAEAVANLQHPNIVQIHEIGEHRGYFFLALEFVDGGRLSEWLAQNPIDPRKAANICLIAAEAMQYAHSRGVVHRDLKPSNIMMDRRQHPKIVDFGIAKRDVQDQTFTQVGEVVGTPAYMSPEQAMGDLAKIGPSADVYALGVVLYELVTGFRPFVAPNTPEVLHKVIHEDAIPPSRLQDSVPADLETICLKCLEKEPNHRYASAGDLAADLRSFLEDMPIAARRTPFVMRVFKWSKRRPVTAAICAFAILCLVCGVGGLTMALRSAKTLSRARQSALENEAILRTQTEDTLYGSQIAQADLLAEKGDYVGAKLVLEKCLPKQDGRDLRGWEWNYVHRLLNNEERKLVVDSWVHCVQFSPDGKYFATAIGNPENANNGNDSSRLPGEVLVWDAQSAKLKYRLAPHDSAVVAVEFSSDSKWLLSRDIIGRSRVTNVHTGEINPHVFQHPSEVKFVSNGQSLLEHKEDHSLNLWSLKPFRMFATLRGNSQSEKYLSFPTSDLIVWNDGPTIKIASGKTGAMLREWQLGSCRMKRLAFSEGEKSFVYQTEDGTVYVQDTNASKPRFQEKSPFKDGWGLQLSLTGRYVVFSERDRELTLVDTTHPQTRMPLVHLPGLHFINNDTRCVVRSNPEPLEMFELPSMRRIETTSYRYEGGCLGWKFGKNEEIVASCGQNGRVGVWELGGEHNHILLQGHVGSIRSIDIHPSGKRIISGGQDGTVRIWDLAKRMRKQSSLKNVIQPGEFLGNFNLSSNGEYLTELWHLAPALRRFNRETGKSQTISVDVTKTIAFPRGDSCFTQDGSKILAAKLSEPNALTLIDAATGKEIRAFHGHSRPPRRIAMSHDGKLAASFCDRPVKEPHLPRELIFWDVETGTNTMKKDIPFIATALAYSPDGLKVGIFGFSRVTAKDSSKIVSAPKLLVLRSSDGDELYSWSGEEEPAAENGIPTTMLAMAFHPNNKMLVGGEFQSGRIRFWDVERKEELHTDRVIQGTQSLTGIAFHPGGDRLAINNYLGMISIWNPYTAEKLITIKAENAEARWGDMAFTGRVMFSQDGNLLLANNWQGAVNSWDGSPINEKPEEEVGTLAARKE